jgi:hypothetical protein
MTITHLRHEPNRLTILGRLRDVADAAVDMVASGDSLEYHVGTSQLRLAEPWIASDGVYETLPVTFTRTAFRQLVEFGDIPLRYADLLLLEDADLLAHNINERMKNSPRLFRLLRPFEGEPWLCRAVLSNGYQAIDNLDVFTAVIRGAARSGINIGDCNVEGDWSDDRFRLRITVPQIAVHAGDLLDGYRSPYSPAADLTRDANDGGTGLLWAGLEVSNSETGGGAATVAPRAVFRICNNGMTRKAEAVRAVHLGGRLDAGPVQWSDETRRKAVELVEAKMADAVTRFCSEDYLNDLTNELRAAKGIEVANVTKAFEVVQSRLGFVQDEIDEAMNAFLRSGDTSVLGLGQAITAAAQTVPDGDRQSELETAFWDVVENPRVYAGV